MALPPFGNPGMPPIMPPVPFTHILPGSVPVGTVVAYAGQTTNVTLSPPLGQDSPTANIETMGWMFCDGRTLPVVQYPELFRVIGTIYGSSGNDTFNIPDYRGQFLRGLWLDRSSDSSNSQTIKTASQDQRTKPPGGDQNGVGSTQPFALQYHEHDYTYAMADKTSTEGAAAGSPAPSVKLTENGPQKSPNYQTAVQVSQYETRPSNVFVNFIIKFTLLVQDTNKPGILRNIDFPLIHEV